MKILALLIAATFLAIGLTTGCQTESTPTTTEVEKTGVETTPVAFNIDGAPTAKLEVPDMMCQYSCAAKVKEVLTAQTGVKDVKIDFESKIATVAVDSAAFDGEAAVAALVDYQFSNTKLIVAE